MSNDKKERLIVFVLVMFIISITGVGYALNGDLLSTAGSATLAGFDYAGDDVIVSSFNALPSTANAFNSLQHENVVLTSGLKVKTTISAKIASNEPFVVEMVFKNNSDSVYTYDGVSVNTNFTNNGNQVEIKAPRIYGIKKGDTIAPGATKTIRVVYYSDIVSHTYNGYDLTGLVDFTFLKGNRILTDTVMLTSIDDSKSKFNVGNKATVKVTVKNLYSTSYDVYFDINNPNIELMGYNDESKVIMDAGEERTFNLLISTEEDFLESVSSHLYIIEGEKNPRDIGEFTIKPKDAAPSPGEPDPEEPDPEEPEEPEMIILENVVGNFTFTSQYGQAGTIGVSIANNSGYNIVQWNAKVYYQAGLGLSFESYSPLKNSVNDEKGTCIIYSEKTYNPGQYEEIKNGQTYTNNLPIRRTKEAEEQPNPWNKVYEPLEIVKIVLDAKLDNGEWSYGNVIYIDKSRATLLDDE